MTYSELKERQQQEINAFPFIWAFNESQLADVRQRLAMLTRPELEQTGNIKNAVRAHKEREQQILSLQEKGLTYDIQRA